MYFQILIGVCFFCHVSTIFITPSIDVKSMMVISGESNVAKDSKAINKDKPLEIENINRGLSGESKDFKDYEEYFERHPDDTYTDDSINNTDIIDENKPNSTLLFFPLRTKIFIDKMLPIFDGTKDKKKKYYQIQDERFKSKEAPRDDLSKINNNSPNIY
uniref:Fam-b protein n=1 Tax=Strongyloides stercoralis TaxID=6248 RepID=A0A913HTS4_STRER